MDTFDLVEAASSSDRNCRAKAAKALRLMKGESNAETLLKLLGDSKRRVRDSAVRSARAFLSDIRVVEKLKTISLDESEKTKIRRAALEVLLGMDGGLGAIGSILKAPEFCSILENEAFRARILPGLLGIELTSRVENLLKEFVKYGTREEAIAATRALCGYRVINIGSITDVEKRAEIRANCEVAFGEVFYWIRR